MSKSFLTLGKEVVNRNTQSLSFKANPLAVGDTITVESFETDHYPTGKKNDKGDDITRPFDYYLVRSEKKAGALIKLAVAEALKITGASAKNPETGVVTFAEKFVIESVTPRRLPNDPTKVMYPLTLSKVYVAGENDFSPARVKALREAIIETDESKAIQNYTAVVA
jgi:hypothetical protein